MRWIQKPPQEYSLLAIFRTEAASAPETYRYDNLREKQQLVRELIEEQRGLCAYSMRSLVDRQGSIRAHVEHIVPQSQDEGRALDYTNLVACFPAPGQPCRYGAVRKADQNIELDKNFVSPLRQGCDQRFAYSFDGSVGESPGDDAAKDTIRILNLNEGELTALRRAQIEGWGLSPLAEHPAGEEDLLDIQALIEEQAAELPEYVVALRQCLRAYRGFLERPPRCC